MEKSPEFLESSRDTKSLSHRRLQSSKRKGVRKEALSKGRSKALLCLVLGLERQTTQLQKKPILEIGIVTSKRQVSKKATERNFAKRRVRAALQLLELNTLSMFLHDRHISQLQILIVCNRDILVLPFVQIVSDLNISLMRATKSLENQDREVTVAN